MRASVASAGNDHRLGANEAPPAIISIFLGDALSPVVDALIKKERAESQSREEIDLGVPAIPNVLRDNTDRNRTSPFAFTGNKFEFRMCGSQQNLSDPNVVLNTAVAEQFDRFVQYVADRSDEDFTKVAVRFVRHTFRDHQRVLFDGNGYSEDWEKEAEKRGLPNLKSTADALPCLVKPENIALFEKYGVLTESESRARYISAAEQYAKLLNIEANTMSYMVRHMYLPALIDYSGDLATAIATKKEIGITGKAEQDLTQQITDGIDKIYETVDLLEKKNAEAQAVEDCGEQDTFYHEEVIPVMDDLRAVVDAMERLCGHDWWPVPSYNRMLFWV